MNKRIPFGILMANWIVGLFFILLLPGSVEGATLPDGKAHLQISKTLVSDLGSLPETPSLEFDLKFFASSALAGGESQFWQRTAAKAGDSNFSTIPLFDVKQTFRHFFFTW